MEWFNGTVEDAIKKALGENKVFIVYVEGWYFRISLAHIVQSSSVPHLKLPLHYLKITRPK